MVPQNGVRRGGAEWTWLHSSPWNSNGSCCPRNPRAARSGKASVRLHTMRTVMLSTKMLLLLVVVAASMVTAGSATDSVAFKDCGHGNVRRVKILGCKKQPCHVKIGSRVTFEASFVAPFTTSSAVNEIGAYIERHRFQLPEPHVDACTSGHIKPSCPMRKGNVYTYRYTLPVREIYPATPATIEYKLVTREGKVIGCSHVPVVIFR